jgi:hypothetical protein
MDDVMHAVAPLCRWQPFDIPLGDESRTARFRGSASTVRENSAPGEISPWASWYSFSA